MAHLFVVIVAIRVINEAQATIEFSSVNSTLKEDFNITFTVSPRDYVIIFKDGVQVCLTMGVDEKGCKFSGPTNPDYEYHCEEDAHIVMIPGTNMTESLHGSVWSCDRLFDGQSESRTLHVNVPVTSVTIRSSPNDANPVEVLSGQQQVFHCTTSEARPLSTLQWFISANNVTRFAQPQLDVCNPGCNDKLISSSVLKYTGNVTDHGKVVYCTASNIEGRYTISQNKTIQILYGPSVVTLNPLGPFFITIEGDKFGPITCSSDCRPNCLFTWTGPNMFESNSSVLEIQKMNRSHDGIYQCTASNSIGIIASSLITVQVDCKQQLLQEPSSLSFGAGIGTGAGVFALVVCIVALSVFCVRRKKDKTSGKSRSNAYDTAIPENSSKNVYNELEEINTDVRTQNASDNRELYEEVDKVSQRRDNQTNVYENR